MVKRLGAWVDLAALEVPRARLFGRCETRNGIAAFDRLVAHVLRRRPSREARRVFGVVDPGSAQRGPTAVPRRRTTYPHGVLVHGPVHARGLPQMENYFSIVQRKVLTPNEFLSLADLSPRLLEFPRHYQTIAPPFAWRCTRKHLAALLRRLSRSIALAA